MREKYKFGFEPWALLLFLLIMLPNFYWFAVPAPNDLLRTPLQTPMLDTVASVAQILTVGGLCLFVRRDRKRLSPTPCLILTPVSLLLYFAGWIGYYLGAANAVVIVTLCLAPCLAFFFFALERKNYIVLPPLFIFAVCHTLSAIINFIL